MRILTSFQALGMQEIAYLGRSSHGQKKYTNYRGPIGEKVLNLAAPLLNQQGFLEGRLLRDWDKIVGSWGPFSCPEKIFFPAQKRESGTLHIRVWGGIALEMQHQILSVLDRVNSYFGYKAVAHLSLKQAPSSLFKATPTPLISVFCTNSQKKKIELLVETISHQELKTALYLLGETLLKERNKTLQSPKNG